MGSKFHASKLTPEQVSAYRLHERVNVNKHLDEYIRQCSKMKVALISQSFLIHYYATSRINHGEACMNMKVSNALN